MTKYLALWLEGPLQSWGIDSKFYNRSTELFPSRSAILGIILSAMGKGGEQTKLLSSFQGLSQTVFAYYHSKNKSPVRLRDFHMVGSGYNDKDKWENLMIPKRSDGTKSSTAQKLTYRYYLQDMAFGVAFQLPTEITLQEEIISALKHPVWDVSLGRRNCPPTEFVFQGEFDIEDKIAEYFKKFSEQKGYTEAFKVFDKPVNNAESLIVNDVPINFGLYKRYMTRTIYIVRA